MSSLAARLAELARVDTDELGDDLLAAFAADLEHALAAADGELASLRARLAAPASLADQAAAARAFAELADLAAAVTARATQVSGPATVQRV